ncbi:hypothetical protein DPEC_G00304470 [Dallia pectoralis]|uniref:Uncharacterized protein n=1 Tax=Dallia pectoralis TaxID=75939 RepID=A0ACC2FDJ0_DALPE|nr:hypothetical protein DPEC_G00304470 [Dallia pectoralis]
MEVASPPLTGSGLAQAVCRGACCPAGPWEGCVRGRRWAKRTFLWPLTGDTGRNAEQQRVSRERAHAHQTCAQRTDTRHVHSARPPDTCTAHGHQRPTRDSGPTWRRTPHTHPKTRARAGEIGELSKHTGMPLSCWYFRRTEPGTAASRLYRQRSQRRTLPAGRPAPTTRPLQQHTAPDTNPLSPQTNQLGLGEQEYCPRRRKAMKPTRTL